MFWRVGQVLLIFDSAVFKGAVVELELTVYQNKHMRGGHFYIVNDLTQLLGSWFGNVAVGNMYRVVDDVQKFPQ